MKKWCEKTDYEYCGGLAIGAGEMVGPLVSQISLSHGIIKNAGEAILKMASSIKNGKKIEDTYVDYHKFIRFLYLYMANRSWVKQIKANGLKKRDLYKQ